MRLDNTHACDADGRPVIVYRGEHGGTGHWLETRLTSLTFCSAEVASTYAMHPNNRRDRPAAPRVMPAYLDIRNPIMNDPSDPFMELSILAAALGPAQAIDVALRIPDAFENTNNWYDRLVPEYDCFGIEDFLPGHPERIELLYGEAFRILDDPDVVAALKARGYDGAIHSGMGESALEVEYRVFSPEQVVPAIGARVDAAPPATLADAA